MKTSDFDASFDANKSIVKSLDLTKASRPGLTAKRINVDIPGWMLASLDREAERLGVTRQSLIKLWLAAKLDHQASSL